jgi:hypothetical protein
MPAARRPGAMVGIYDFSYAPYALGDALTWLVNLEIGAAEAGTEAIEAYLVAHPGRPSSKYQPFITAENYVTVLEALVPAFLCSPQLRVLRVIRDLPTFNLFLLREVLARRPMWPSLWSHLNRRLDFMSYRRMNAFYDRRGYLPRLDAPRGYGAWADGFRQTRCPGRFVVAVNVRQGVRSLAPAYLHRDSPVEEWLAFMAGVAVDRPEVLFVLLGAFPEWDRRFWRLPNVLIPRVLGFGLGHELALLQRSDLFMGTSSGFATMATFAGVPYVITKIEPMFAAPAGVPVGARHYRFAAENQVLYWETETREVLRELFEARVK